MGPRSDGGRLSLLLPHLSSSCSFWRYCRYNLLALLVCSQRALLICRLESKRAQTTLTLSGGAEGRVKVSGRNSQNGRKDRLDRRETVPRKSIEQMGIAHSPVKSDFE